mmetsp:Transcript_3582/g.22488  ORF Transcript_3582/g.22488 Transcript_3582/m.22488 type:complete len:205 (-) Transcript_3582:1891-2505(-)
MMFTAVSTVMQEAHVNGIACVITTIRPTTCTTPPRCACLVDLRASLPRPSHVRILVRRMEASFVLGIGWSRRFQHLRPRRRPLRATMPNRSKCWKVWIQCASVQACTSAAQDPKVCTISCTNSWTTPWTKCKRDTPRTCKWSCRKEVGCECRTTVVAFPLHSTIPRRNRHSKPCSLCCMPVESSAGKKADTRCRVDCTVWACLW